MMSQRRNNIKQVSTEWSQIFSFLASQKIILFILHFHIQQSGFILIFNTIK